MTYRSFLDDFSFIDSYFGNGYFSCSLIFCIFAPPKSINMRTRILFPALLLWGACTAVQASDSVLWTTSIEGGLTSLSVQRDTTSMNWILTPDGTQYAWVGPRYQWGLGQLKADGKVCQWLRASRISYDRAKGESEVLFDVSSALTLQVNRHNDGPDLVETYTFCNHSSAAQSLSDIEINTPFNDNYPDADQCINRRCNAHIWAAGTGSYVCAIRMGGYAPHLGMMLTEGSLEGYVIRERSREKGMSNFRGVISLCPSALTLAPGQSYTLQWRIFAHQGEEDFYAQMLSRGGVQVTADQYVAQVGETVPYTVRTANGEQKLSYRVQQTGDVRVPIAWNNGETWLELHGVSSYSHLLNARASFILDHQQYSLPGDKRDGAFLPYNNATEKLYCNWLNEKNHNDFTEGRERLGMGLFLAYLYCDKANGHHDKARIRKALVRYADFVRNGLQDPDFKTWSDADRAQSRISSMDQRHRIYNYAWVAHFYCQMYEVTHDRKYVEWAYRTEMAAHHYGGYNFYSIDIPVYQSITQLRKANMTAQADSLLAEYRKAAEHYMANGVHYPKSEVNYEQSIVAPSTNFLLEMYLVTKEQQYLDAARQMMPVVEAFGGQQPSSHLNDMAIRHWDAYWFGIPAQWGDTQPHYWSCVTADCFENYAKATGDTSYILRAQRILRGNLSLFTEEGRGGCAFVYPLRVDDVPTHCLNPMANDQDFALMYYLKWLK